MSDNKKYYYLKLKDNFFEQDAIQAIEGEENGYIYSNIILKLYLKSVKHEGCLKITEAVPYSPAQVGILAKAIHHDIAHVKEAIKKALEYGIMALVDGHEMWFTDIQNYIGHSSTEGDRIKAHRERLKNPQKYRKLKEIEATVQTYDKCTPELELDTEREIEIKRETKPKPPRHKYGEYKRVLLTDDQLNTLKASFPTDWESRIQNLDEYMEMKGATYKNHLLTIKKWAHKDFIKARTRPIEDVATL